MIAHTRTHTRVMRVGERANAVFNACVGIWIGWVRTVSTHLCECMRAPEWFSERHRPERIFCTAFIVRLRIGRSKHTRNKYSAELRPYVPFVPRRARTHASGFSRVRANAVRWHASDISGICAYLRTVCSRRGFCVSTISLGFPPYCRSRRCGGGGDGVVDAGDVAEDGDSDGCALLLRWATLLPVLMRTDHAQ